MSLNSNYFASTNLKNYGSTVINQVKIGARMTLNANDIVMLKAEKNYATLYLSYGKQILVSYHLDKLLIRLHGFSFFIKTNRKQVIIPNYLDISKLEDLIIMGQKKNYKPKKNR